MNSLNTIKNIFIIALIILLLQSCNADSSRNGRDYANKSDTSSMPSTPYPIPKSELLGTFKTSIIDTDESRMHNLRLAINKLNNPTLSPGKVFSFNEILGKRDSKNGYKTAKIIVKGERDWGVGGGVCQISSTLYNAALNAKLEIVERHQHSNSVGYVPLGQDAAVEYGTQDLKFKNNKSFPVRIKLSLESNKVSAFIYKV